MDLSEHLSELNAKIPASAGRRRIDQCGAICCRVERGGRLSVLLVTSRDTGRWVIPKGYVGRKEKPYRCAQREALEEAYESFVVKQFPKAPYVLPAAVQTIFDIAATRDPRAKTVDPQGFVEMRFVRELDQSGTIDKLYAPTR